MTASSQTLQHVGEWKIELRGESLEALFTELARVIADAAGSRVAAPGVWERVQLEARDHATLLVDWANELIGRSEAAGRAYASARNLVIEPHEGSTVRLTGDVRGELVDEWISPLKAATYHGALVERQEDGWRAVILFDV